MNIPLGMSLPHRSPDPIDMTAVREVARRADALRFRDLWVTENAVDHVFSFDLCQGNLRGALSENGLYVVYALSHGAHKGIRGPTGKRVEGPQSDGVSWA